MSIRLVLDNEHILYHYEISQKRYSESYSKLETAANTLSFFVKELAKRVDGLRIKMQKGDAIEETNKWMQSELDSFNSMEREMHHLSEDLHVSLSKMNIDPSSDPMMQKIKEQFPEFFEQLEKINAFVKDNLFAGISTQNEKDNLRKILEVKQLKQNVEILKNKWRENRSKMDDLINQMKKIATDCDSERTSLTTEKPTGVRSPKVQNSPQRTSDFSSYYYPIDQGLLGLPIFSPEGPSVRLTDILEEEGDGSKEHPFRFSPGSEYTSLSFSSAAFSTEDLFEASSSSTSSYAYPSFGVLDECFEKSQSDWQTAQAIPKKQTAISARGRTLPKSRSDSLISYIPESAARSVHSLGNDRDSNDEYPSESLDIVKVERMNQTRGKLQSLANMKSKSFDSGLEDLLKISNHRENEKNYNDFFGEIEGEEDMGIHIQTIHARTEQFLQRSPGSLHYSLFEKQLEFTWAHAEKIIQKVALWQPISLRGEILDKAALKKELIDLIDALHSMETSSRLTIVSQEWLSKWGKYITDIAEDCDKMEEVADRMQSLIMQLDEREELAAVAIQQWVGLPIVLSRIVVGYQDWIH